MRLFISTAFQNRQNTSYPIEKVIGSVDELKEAVAYDHVGCEFRDGKNNRGTVVRAYRNNKCFVAADCIIMDCDNTSSDPTADLDASLWKTPSDVAHAFPNVEHYVVYSRNHMKEKNGLPARPKFHIYFPLARTLTDFKVVEELKEEVYRFFPSFDPNAIKVSQFIFGVENPTVEHVDGNQKIDEWVEAENRLPDVIPEGERNSTLSAFAGQIITRYGDTERAREAFDQAAERCSTPLETSELDTIWRSAQSFFHETVAKDPTYKDPMEYEFGADKGFTLKDMERLLKKMGIRIRYNDITAKMEIAGLPKGIRPGDAANALPGEIRSHMNEKGIHCSRSDMDDYLTNILAKSHYNPIERMVTMTTWDGEDRITELISIMGVTEEREATLIKKWLHQCVAMALNDEKKPYSADGVLVLQGPQGMGKTLLCSRLAVHPDWFGEGVSIDVNSKDSLIQATGHWIVELGELDSTLKKEQSALKAFLTNKRDEIRLPYARAATTKARRVSFCATVNPATFLIDETGSRRFWVIKPNIDLERVLKMDEPWLRQMWTQVYTQFYLPDPQGFRLNKEEMKELQDKNEEYAKPLQGEIELLDQLNFEVPEKHWSWTTATNLAQNVNLKFLSAVQIGRVLTRLARLDPRIQSKRIHHTTQYWLPPSREFKYHPGDDDRGALAGSGTVPSWAKVEDFSKPEGAEDEQVEKAEYDWRAELEGLDEETRRMVEELLG